MVQDVTETGCLKQELEQQRNALCLAHDLLAQQNLQLAAANTELQRLDEVKSAFVSIAAHELRSPLTSILGYLELLLGGDAGDLNLQQKDYLRVIEYSAQRLVQTSNDLLDVTRIEAGRLEMVLQPTDLVAVAELAVRQLLPQLKAKSQQLTLHAPARLPLALCDADRARQIIGILLGNANQYSPPGTAIVLSLCEADAAGFLQITVSDQGIGIAPEERASLFRPFFRASSATQPGASGSGAGLGLYIARSLVDLHGGRIWFDSVPGKGTTFYVTLPSADNQ